MFHWRKRGGGKGLASVTLAIKSGSDSFSLVMGDSFLSWVRQLEGRHDSDSQKQQ